MPSDLLQAALRYAASGLAVVPIQPRAKGPSLVPLEQATTNQATIRDWWGRRPNAGIGLPLGRLVVVDVDDEEGVASLARLVATYGNPPAGPVARTGSGLHLYFSTAGRLVESSFHLDGGGLGPGIDVLGEGGWTQLPPTEHPSGVRYQWLAEPLGAIQAPPLPAWMTTARRDYAPGRGLLLPAFYTLASTPAES